MTKIISGEGFAVTSGGPSGDPESCEWVAHVIDQPSVRVAFEADPDAHNAYLLSVARVHLSACGWSPEWQREAAPPVDARRALDAERCDDCRRFRDCTPGGLEFGPAVAGDGVATLTCPCKTCHTPTLKARSWLRPESPDRFAGGLSADEVVRGLLAEVERLTSRLAPPDAEWCPTCANGTLRPGDDVGERCICEDEGPCCVCGKPVRWPDNAYWSGAPDGEGLHHVLCRLPANPDARPERDAAGEDE